MKIREGGGQNLPKYNRALLFSNLTVKDKLKFTDDLQRLIYKQDMGNQGKNMAYKIPSLKGWRENLQGCLSLVSSRNWDSPLIEPFYTLITILQ